MRGLIAIALCAGCYSPTISPGAPCETDCPGNLVCIDHVCRAPGWTGDVDAGPGSDGMVPLTDGMMIDAPDGPPDDVDADTVPNGVDNCPSKANTDQHDEDADAVGDVCDLCPHISGSALDSDADGVGDACDPQPSIAKQRIRFFDPFTSDRPEWMLATGGGRVGETLRLTGGSTSLTMTTGETRIAMAGMIPAIVNPGGQHQLALYFGKASATDNTYHYTEFYDSGGSAGEVSITKANGGMFTNLGGGNYTGTLPPGAWSMRIDESVAAQQAGFSAVLGGAAFGPFTGNTSALPSLTTGAIIELYVRNTDVRIDYFIVIETLP